MAYAAPAESRDPRTAAPQFDASRVLLGLALLITALAYINTLRFEFLYDDIPQIIYNTRVQSWSNAPSFFLHHVWWTPQDQAATGNYYRPIFLLWLLANYTLFGLKPLGWHLTTVLVHLVATWLVYRLGWRITGDKAVGAMVALVFGLHPTHIESVAWISGVTDPLMAVFTVGCVLAYVRARNVGMRQGRWLAASVVLFVLAMLTKETAFMVPVVLVAYEYFFRDQEEGKGNWVRGALWRLVPMLVTAVAYLVVRHTLLGGLQHPSEQAVLDPHTPGTLLLSMPTVLWFYVWHSIWPFGLSVSYSSPLTTSFGFAKVVLPLLGVLAAGVILWAIAWRSRVGGFAAAWLVAFMVPAVIGVRVFEWDEAVHDRYLYLPVVGLAFLVALGVNQIRVGRGQLFGHPATRVVAALVLAVVLGGATAAQNIYWASGMTLFAHAVTMAPNNSLALSHLANEMYKRKRFQTAMELYQRAVQINPNHWGSHFALGITSFELGDMQATREHLQIATRLFPGNAHQFYFLGMAQLKLGQPAEAEKSLRRAIEILPGAARFHVGLGMALEQEGNLTGAREQYREELAISPNPEARDRLAEVERRLEH